MIPVFSDTANFKIRVHRRGLQTGRVPRPSASAPHQLGPVTPGNAAAPSQLVLGKVQPVQQLKHGGCLEQYMQ